MVSDVNKRGNKKSDKLVCRKGVNIIKVAEE